MNRLLNIRYFVFVHVACVSLVSSDPKVFVNTTHDLKMTTEPSSIFLTTRNQEPGTILFHPSSITQQNLAQVANEITTYDSTGFLLLIYENGPHTKSELLKQLNAVAAGQAESSMEAAEKARMK